MSKSYKKSTSKYISNYPQLNEDARQYFHHGYDIFFVHGWLTSYLSSSNDSEDDLALPFFVVLDEEKITNEQLFNKFVDDLLMIYSELADNIYEKNKPLKPLLSLDKHDVKLTQLTEAEKLNLFNWLFGYMYCYLANEQDIVENCSNDKLIDDKFSPALFVVAVTLLLLADELKITTIYSGDILQEYLDLTEDIVNLWDTPADQNLEQQLSKLKLADLITELNGALNTIFYVTRLVDEERITNNSTQKLLNKLVVH